MPSGDAAATAREAAVVELQKIGIRDRQIPGCLDATDQIARGFIDGLAAGQLSVDVMERVAQYVGCVVIATGCNPLIVPSVLRMSRLLDEEFIRAER